MLYIIHARLFPKASAKVSIHMEHTSQKMKSLSLKHSLRMNLKSAYHFYRKEILKNTIYNSNQHIYAAKSTKTTNNNRREV